MRSRHDGRKRGKTQSMTRFHRKRLLSSMLLLLMGLCTGVQAQKRITIQATAMGTSTQMGRLYNINILIDQFSTKDDQQALIKAFERSGQPGLVDVLEHMKSKGRIRFASGGVGNDIKHIIELPSEKGRRIRLVTDRYLAFGEFYSGKRRRPAHRK